MADLLPAPRRWLTPALLALLLTAPVAHALDPEHPAELPPLWSAREFPRCTAKQLALAGFPDPMHIWWWSSWQVMTDHDGRTYGPGSLCRDGQVVPREGLETAPGRIAYHLVELRSNPGYKPCDFMTFVEVADWGLQVASDLFALSVADTMHLENPFDVAAYHERTGQGTWRLFRRTADGYVLHPVRDLMARSLDGHAAFMVATDWVLTHNGGDRLPPWLRHGLVQYVSEYGVHLVNYMAEFRDREPILLSPAAIDAILARGIDPDPARDRHDYRLASYGAFLMVWQLVENEGGLAPLREMLGLVAAGEDPDAAARQAYGLDLADLAAMLDPTALGEPLGTFTQVRRPNHEPE